MNLRTTLVLAAVLFLSGCAAGQKFGYSEASFAVGRVPAGAPVAVAVLDARPYVLEGRKPESFVGLSRGGYGNPFDVTTRSGAPLAADMTTALATAIGAAGREARAVPVPAKGGVEGAKAALAGAGAERLLLFRLVEWKTDTMARTGLDYILTLDVMDRGGTVLATERIYGKEVSGSAIGSAEKDARRWFGEKFQRLLSAPAIAAAL